MKHFLKELLKKYGHIWILGYGFIYLPWFMHLEKTVTPITISCTHRWMI